MLTGFDFIQNDLQILRSDASGWKKAMAFGDALLNVTNGIALSEGLASAVQNARLAWQLRNATTAEARLQIMEEIARRQGAQIVVEGDIPYRYVEKIPGGGWKSVIQIPEILVEGGGSELSGAFFHELAHVRQGYGILHRLSMSSTEWNGLILYLLNPVEVNAFASGIISQSNLVNLLLSKVAQTTISTATSTITSPLSNLEEDVIAPARKKLYQLLGL